MMDDTQNPTATDATDATAPDAPASPETETVPRPTSEQTVPYSRFDQVNRRAKELAERLAAIEAAQAEADRRRMEEEARWKDLYEAEKKAREEEAKAREAERLAALRQRIGEKHGLPAAIIARLTGTTEAELEADAAAIAAELPRPKAPNIDSGRGKEPVGVPDKPFREWSYAEQEALYARDPDLFRRLAYGE